MRSRSMVLPPIQREHLPNGLSLVVGERRGVPLAAARLTIAAGSALDPPGRFGLSHLVAETIRRGTRTRSGAKIDEEVESLGADLGVCAEEDATTLGFSAPIESLPKLLDLMADVVTEPSFPTREFDTIRRREMAALAHEIDEAGAVADRAMLCSAYGGHPYGHPTEGLSRHLQSIRRGDALQFHKRFFGPASSTLVTVAAQDTTEVMALCRKKLGRWRSAAQTMPHLPAPPPCERRVICVDMPAVNQCHVRVALPAIPRSSGEYFPALVAAAVFGGGFTSRLMEAVRVNRGLSYSIRSRFATGKTTGLFIISTFTKNESAADMLDVIFGEVSRFCDGGPTREELERTQGYLAGLYPLSFETHDQIAAKLSDMALYGIPIEDVTQHEERIRAVTAAQCRDLAQRHFPLDRGLVVVVGPAKRLAPALARFGSVTVVPANRFV